MSARIPTLILSGVVLLLGCGSEPGEPPSPGTSTPPPAEAAEADMDATAVARIGDEVITLDDLDTFIKEELWDRETGGGNVAKTFEVREAALDRMLRTRVIAAEAARRNTTEEALILGEMAAAPVTDEEIQQFYDERIDQMGGATIEQVGGQISQYLEQKRGVDYVETLMQGANVEVLMEAPRVSVAADGPSKGPDDAAVTIIEFSDFQCPFCARAKPVLEEVLERYPDDVRLVYRHLPLDRIHPRARAAAEAAACADEQGQFWAFHDLLFDNPNQLADPQLRGFAESLGLDIDAWSQCVDEKKYAAKVSADLEAGQAVGLSGTPAFIVNGRLLTGARPIEDFVALIDAEIANSQADDAS